MTQFSRRTAQVSRRTTLLASGAGLAALALAACGAGGPEGPTEEDGVTTIRIGASPAPHAPILQFVHDHLADAAGLAPETEPYTASPLPTQAPNEGDRAAAL